MPMRAVSQRGGESGRNCRGELADGHTGKGTTSSRASYALFSKAALAAEGQQSSLKPEYAEEYRYSDGTATNPRTTGF